jgi:hypothetical protein
LRLGLRCQLIISFVGYFNPFAHSLYYPRIDFLWQRVMLFHNRYLSQI